MTNFVCHKFQTIWSLSFVTVISEIWGLSDLHKFQSIKQLMQRKISFHLRMRLICSCTIISLVWSELTQALNFLRCLPVLASSLKQSLRQHNSYSAFFDIKPDAHMFAFNCTRWTHEKQSRFCLHSVRWDCSLVNIGKLRSWDTQMRVRFLLCLCLRCITA